jgi:hypothetical protein
MNERIKELAEKATIRGEEYLPGNDGHPTPTFYFDKEKFAELIVRECADISDASFHNGSAGFLAIKKHFGVEECIICIGLVY